MKRILYTICGLLVSVLQVSAAVVTADDSVKDIRQINASAVEVLYRDGHRLTIDFYSDNIFRLFQDNHGGIVRDPAAACKNSRRPTSKACGYSVVDTQ